MIFPNYPLIPHSPLITINEVSSGYQILFKETEIKFLQKSDNCGYTEAQEFADGMQRLLFLADDLEEN